MSETALIRVCDGCQTVTAIDMDNTPEHRREMELTGQTIREVPKTEAMQLWNRAGTCVCGKTRFDVWWDKEFGGRMKGSKYIGRRAWYAAMKEMGCCEVKEAGR